MKTCFYFTEVVFIFFIFSFVPTGGVAQSENNYSHNIKAANYSMRNKDYRKAAKFYSIAFSTNHNQGRIDHRYMAAQCWALGGEPDSAFYQLERITKAGYNEYLEILTDTAFSGLRNDLRWPELLKSVEDNMRNAEENSNSLFKNLNKQLVAVLDTIYFDDQIYRRRMDEVEQKYGSLSVEMKSQKSLIAKYDSVNTKKIKGIIDKYGWLSKEVVGERGATTLFLVTQHSDLSTQLQWLPFLREAVKQKKALPSDLALLEDRIAIKQGKKQIYGSQIGKNEDTNRYYVEPLDNPEDVDKRRSEVGLAPIKEYVSRWGIIWSIDQYYRDLKMLDAKK